MYGMLNRAIVECLRERYGDAPWKEIEQRAATGVDHFVLMKQYPDDVSYALVGVAAEVLGRPADELLSEIGRYWIQFALRSGYHELLESAGRTIPEVLANLDALHFRVAKSFPELREPSFWCTEVGPDSLVLHYRSERRGLAPMVRGLVEGLGDMLETPVTVRQVASREQGADHDQFLVRFAWR